MAAGHRQHRDLAVHRLVHRELPGLLARPADLRRPGLAAGAGQDPGFSSRIAPPGGSALYVLAPVPHITPAFDWSREADAYRDLVIGLRDGSIDPLERLAHGYVLPPGFAAKAAA